MNTRRVAWMAKSVTVGCSECAAQSAVATSIGGSDTIARTNVAGNRRVARALGNDMSLVALLIFVRQPILRLSRGA